MAPSKTPTARKKRPSLQPRKVPQQSRAAQTVDTILEAAARLLETAGLEGLNTNAVARRAGVSIGSLYQYFPGKDALVVALSLRERALFHDEAQGALAKETGVQALRHLIAVSVRQQLRRPVLARLLDFEENRPPIAKALAASKGGFASVIAHVLAHDDIPPQPDIAVATDDLGAIIRALTDAAGERGDVDHDDLERRIGLALFGYLGMEDKPRGKPAKAVARPARGTVERP